MIWKVCCVIILLTFFRKTCVRVCVRAGGARARALCKSKLMRFNNGQSLFVLNEIIVTLSFHKAHKIS